ncbi:ATP-dependent DNA ligase, partial [Enterococcus faecium]
WAQGLAPPPLPQDAPAFRPFMLSHPLERDTLDLAEFAAEWKWDGIRVQIAHGGNETRLYSRGGDDISAAFPEVVAALH